MRKISEGLIPGGVVLIVLIALVLSQSFVIIGPGHRGVVLVFGAVQKKVLGEGLHLRIPLIQKVVHMEVRIKKKQVDAAAASKDLQDTTSTIALNYHILPEDANKVFQQIGQNYEERIIDPAIQEVVKAVTAKYTAIELITQRERVKNDIKGLLEARLKPYSIVVDDFSIVNFSFSQAFAQAIEAKQVAEQMALKAQRDLERVKIEADQKITQAKAEAEALRLQKENVTPQLIQLRQIEANMKAIEKWNGVLPQVTTQTVPFIGVK
ncbi:TPA: HflC protein [bacterium]|nr:HflC protein [bacterium]